MKPFTAVAKIAALMLVATTSNGRALVGKPVPTNRAFHELNLAGAPNSAGFSVIGIRKGRAPYFFDVNGSVIAAGPRGSRPTAAGGADLVGLEFDLRDAAAKKYILRISGAATTAYWAAPTETVPTYTLTYTSATQPVPQPLCTAGENEAILFAGDRYDAERKTVTATGPGTAGWFNIACSGTALAKLHLTRHTEASQVVKTTALDRQAMLKMFTADVCGDGTSFTVHGQPLLWADANHLTRFVAPAATLEAVWTDRGALCLDSPRRPELAAAIAARCGPLPSCTTQRGYVISANP